MRSSSALASASVSRQITYPDTPNSSGGRPASRRRPFRSATFCAMTSGASPCMTYASAWAEMTSLAFGDSPPM